MSALIRRNRKTFDMLLARAVRSQNTDHRDAIGWAAAAASWATHNHCGIYRSYALEQLLTRLGDRLEWDPPGARRGGVLHVLTVADAVGGHTVWASEWIRRDQVRPQSVFVTEQSRVLGSLASAAEATGGFARGVELEVPIHIRAAVLREAVAGADLVVLSQHMHDVVPALALAYAGRPNVAILNHADHRFWVGLSVADLLVEYRAAALPFSRARRGVQPDRQVLMSLPLPERTFVARIAARRELGLRDSEVAIVTVGGAHKYEGPNPGLPDVLNDVLDSNPEAVLFAIGPGGSRAFSRLDSTRARVLQPTPAIQNYMAAADIYVDSYPVGGGLTVLEAAAHGAACVAMTDFAYFTNPLGLASMITVPSLGRLRVTLTELIRNPSERTRLGHEARAEVIGHHDVSAFTNAIHEIHRRAVDRVPTADVAIPEAELDGTDMHLLRLGVNGGWSRTLEQAIRHGFWSRRLPAFAWLLVLPPRFRRRMAAIDLIRSRLGRAPRGAE